MSVSAYNVHPSLVLKARHLGGSAFCNFHRLGVPEQALPHFLGLIGDELLCVYVCV